MLYYVELMNSLKRGVLAPVYLFYGEETYLLEQAVRRFAEYFTADAETDLNCEILDGETLTTADILGRAESAPFLTDKRLLIVKNPMFIQAKPAVAKAKKAISDEDDENAGGKTTDREKAFLNYLANPMPSTCLVFTTGFSPDKRKKIFKEIKRNGRVVEFSYLKKTDLRRWLNRKAQDSNKAIQAEAAELFIDSAGPALQSLAMEWEKLDSFTAGQDRIVMADVRGLVTPAAEENIFEIMDAIGHRRCWEALRGIRELLAAKEPPQRILTMIARQFRLLLLINELHGRGYAEQAIISRLNLHPFVYRKIAVQRGSFNQSVLAEALIVLADLETDIKTGRQEFYPALETFLLRLSIDA